MSNENPLDDNHLDPIGRFLARSWKRTAVMWTAIALSLALVVLLSKAGWGENAWSIAALALLLSCFAVCGWAAYRANRDIDEVGEQARRLVAQRRRDPSQSPAAREESRPLHPPGGHQ
jgi:hypothetical protein